MRDHFDSALQGAFVEAGGSRPLREKRDDRGGFGFQDSVVASRDCGFLSVLGPVGGKDRLMHAPFFGPLRGDFLSALPISAVKKDHVGR